MGMFDYIRFKMECPNCKTLMKDFQSKDGGCFMYLLNFWEVNNFYDSCGKCRTWVEFTLKLKNRPNRELTLKDYKKEIRIPTKKEQKEHKKRMDDFTKLLGSKQESKK